METVTVERANDWCPMRCDPFTIRVPDADLDDLRRRLAATRWPDGPPEAPGDTGWEYGTDGAYLRALVDHWRTRFDWRAAERRLNAWPHWTADLDGRRLHFARLPGRGPAPLPIVLTHGWPSTFFEMSKLAPRLADPAAFGGDPADAFEVIVPSLPGYGFSDAPRRRGESAAEIADLWARLMEGLGFARFAAHGGDIGSGVTAFLGLRHAERLVGLHVTAVLAPWLGEGSAPLTEAERAYVELGERWKWEEGGYTHLQRTRPQTLGFGLADSPAGLASWIVEKFRAWSDCGGDLESRFTKDELLTNLSLYWFTNTIASSVRLYFENQNHRPSLGRDDRIRVPCGVALTREPIDRAPREWAERHYDVRRFTDLPRGGHFLALEEPDLLAEDLRAFFRPLRAEA